MRPACTSHAIATLASTTTRMPTTYLRRRRSFTPRILWAQQPFIPFRSPVGYAGPMLAIGEADQPPRSPSSLRAGTGAAEQPAGPGAAAEGKPAHPGAVLGRQPDAAGSRPAEPGFDRDCRRGRRQPAAVRPLRELGSA